MESLAVINSQTRASQAGVLQRARAVVQLMQKYGINPTLPKTAQMLADFIGLEATIALVDEEGGNEIRLPAIVDGASVAWARLAEIVGHDAAAKLVRDWPDTRIYVPMCTGLLVAVRNVEIIESCDRGEPLDSIRRRFGVSRTHLFRLLKRAKPEFSFPTQPAEAPSTVHPGATYRCRYSQSIA